MSFSKFFFKFKSEHVYNSPSLPFLLECLVFRFLLQLHDTSLFLLLPILLLLLLLSFPLLLHVLLPFLLLLLPQQAAINYKYPRVS